MLILKIIFGFRVFNLDRNFFIGVLYYVFMKRLGEDINLRGFGFRVSEFD